MIHLKELRQENIYQILYESKYEVLEFEINQKKKKNPCYTQNYLVINFLLKSCIFENILIYLFTYLFIQKSILQTHVPKNKGIETNPFLL